MVSQHQILLSYLECICINNYQKQIMMIHTYMQWVFQLRHCLIRLIFLEENIYINAAECLQFTHGFQEMPKLLNQQPIHHHPKHALQGNDLFLPDIAQRASRPVQNHWNYYYLQWEDFYILKLFSRHKREQTLVR